MSYDIITHSKNDIVTHSKNEVKNTHEKLKTATQIFFANCNEIKDVFGDEEVSFLHHVEDANWIAKKLLADWSLKDTSLNQALFFVKVSPFFAKEKHAYQLRVVKRLIEWVLEGRHSYISNEEYDEDFIIFHASYDIGFREGIVRVLSEAGMSHDMIEEGLERNADLWFERTIRSTFRNQFNPLLILQNPDLKPADEEHEEKWLKLRRFAYYCEHKDSVNQYGTIHPDMQMTFKEVREIATYLRQKNSERQQYLENAAADKKKKQTSLIFNCDK